MVADIDSRRRSSPSNRRTAKAAPESIAFRFLSGGVESSVLTHRSLDEEARALAVKLLDEMAPGDRVALLHMPGREFLCGFFGCLYAGVVAVPLVPPILRDGHAHLMTLLRVFDDAGVQLVLTTPHIRDRIEKLLNQANASRHVRFLTMDMMDLRLAKAWSEPAVDSRTLAFLQYTSGSTGAPKGVRVTHGNFLSNVDAMRERLGCTERDRGVVWVPPYHDMGLIGGIFLPLYAGFPSVLMSPVDFLKRPLRWLSAIDKYRATISRGGARDRAFLTIVQRPPWFVQNSL